MAVCGVVSERDNLNKDIGSPWSFEVSVIFLSGSGVGCGCVGWKWVLAYNVVACKNSIIHLLGSMFSIYPSNSTYFNVL